MCLCRVKRRGPISTRRAARVWKRPTHARLERLSIHCSSLSYAFVHQKGDYSANPALCHSQVCISKSTNINVLMYEEPVFCVRARGPTTVPLPLSVSHAEWQEWCLQKITTYGTNVIMTHSVFWLQPLVPYFTICAVRCVSVVACSRTQPSSPARASERRSASREHVAVFLPLRRAGHFCKCHNALYTFLYRFLSNPHIHIPFSSNARVNIIFCDYRCGCAVMWGAAEHRPLLWRMHNHSKQCPKGNWGFYKAVSQFSLYHFWSLFVVVFFFLQRVGIWIKSIHIRGDDTINRGEQNTVHLGNYSWAVF